MAQTRPARNFLYQTTSYELPSGCDRRLDGMPTIRPLTDGKPLRAAWKTTKATAIRTLSGLAEAGLRRSRACYYADNEAYYADNEAPDSPQRRTDCAANRLRRKYSYA
jgi:hypothetical protein